MDELPRVKVTDGFRFCSCWWMVSLTRYMLVEESHDRPNAVSNWWQAWMGSHKYGKVVSMRATMLFERSVMLLASVAEAVMDSIPITRLCESLPASGKLELVGTKRDES